MIREVCMQAEAFRAHPRYKTHMEMLEHSPLAKLRTLSSFDYAQLGHQLRKFEQYKKMVSENGTLKDLGQLPRYAFDVITANYGASVIPVLASVQAINGQQGLVYFKSIQARTTRGNVVAGDRLRNAVAAPNVQAVGFAGEKVEQNLGNTTNGVQTYALNLTPAPIRPRTLRLKLTTLVGEIFDDGEGQLATRNGALGYGTINYTTGLVNVTFIPPMTGAEVISASFGTNFEENGALPTIISQYSTENVEAELFAVRSELGMLKAFEMKQTFGKSAEEEMIMDLTQEINAELGNTMIARMANAAFSSSTFDAQNLAIGEVEHKLSFDYRLTEASAKIGENAGRGEVNLLIAGSKACAIIEQQRAQFERTSTNTSGPSVYGMYKKTIPVIRALNNPILGDNEVLAVYKGTSAWDAPAVYAPYMPLVVNGSLPVLNNVMKTQAAAVVMSAMKVVVNRFIHRIDILNNNF